VETAISAQADGKAIDDASMNQVAAAFGPGKPGN
jgi:hypothetical protein